MAHATPLTFTYDPAGRLTTFTLPTGSSVTLTYDLNGNRLHESVKPPPDVTKPKVASANIQDKATGVAVDIPITVTFSEAMNSATFTDQTFTVVGPGGQQVVGTYASANNTATFTPNAPLQYFTEYTVTLTTGIKDQAGNPLAQNYTFGFRTMVAPAIGMAGGSGHSVMVLSDGTVWAWGFNSNGQVGDGTTTDRNAPVPVSGISGMDAVGSGATHTLAIRQADGAVFAWGKNSLGQLGDGTTTDRLAPVPVSDMLGATAVAGGLSHSIALGAGGTVWAWGNNAFGQLGDGTTQQRSIPVQVVGLDNITAIAAGGSHGLALRTDPVTNVITLWAWGYNGEGQLGDGTTVNRSVPVQIPLNGTITEIAAGLNHSLARLNDGALRAWGANNSGQLGVGSTTKQLVPTPVTGLPDPAAAIAAGANFSMARLGNGTVRAWGYNASAQLGDGTFVNRLTPVAVGGLADIQTLAAGQSHAFALQQNGTLVGWGYNFYGQVGDGKATFVAYTPTPVPGLAVDAVANGGKHTLALLADKTVVAWGSNSNGQLGDGTTTNWDAPVPVVGLPPNITDIAAGSRFSVAVESNDKVWVWGINSSKELGLGAAGADVLQPVQLPWIGGVTAVAAGDFSTAAIVGEGETATVWTWGSNSNGQLGNGGHYNPGVPAAVPGLMGVTALAGGGRHFLALKGDKTIAAWGRNADGELGDGTKSERTAPSVIPGFFDVIAIGAGHRHSLAVTKSATDPGTAWTWGLNASGQLGDGTFTSRTTPMQVANLPAVAAVAGGASHSLARLADGAIRAWGFNAFGQLGDGTAIIVGKNVPKQTLGLIDTDLIDAGTGNSSYALDLDTGALYEWGWNGVTAFVDGTVPWVIAPTAVLWP